MFDKSCLSSFPPEQLTLLATLIGILLIDGLDAAQQNALGNLVLQIGQTITTNAALLQTNLTSQGSRKKYENILQQIDKLLKQPLK